MRRYQRIIFAGGGSGPPAMVFFPNGLLLLLTNMVRIPKQYCNVRILDNGLVHYTQKLIRYSVYDIIRLSLLNVSFSEMI